LLARFGLLALRSASGLAAARFAGAHAKAIFAGISSHSVLPLEQRASAAAGLLLGGMAHAVGWPVVRGGSQGLADALAGYLRNLGGEIETSRRVRSLADVPPTRVVLFDTTPLQLLEIAASELPGWYRRQLRRFRHGPGVFKLDWALDGPIPWRAAACLRAGTIHVGGTMAEIEASERAVAHGEHPDRPFVLMAQQSLFDPSRAPAGNQTAWAYCHVPHGSPVDMTGRIEAQVERFAPGFRDRILARHVMGPAAMEARNANHVGGDITGGVVDVRQLLTRPAVRLNPYTTPNPRLFLCSASTPPGGGVHGMCGFWAARSVLRRKPGFLVAGNDGD
jgi:phytoene dehydrogenase-like protein